MYEKERAKADVLIEAIPYIRKFAGTTVVVKYGGSAMVDEKLKKSVIKDIALLKYIGLKPVVVHGGGKEITALLDRLGKETQFVDGLRVTDAETAGVAEMVLSGSIGKSLVENLESVGVEACGINGKDGHTLQAKKRSMRRAAISASSERSRRSISISSKHFLKQAMCLLYHQWESIHTPRHTISMQTMRHLR